MVFRQTKGTAAVTKASLGIVFFEFDQNVQLLQEIFESVLHREPGMAEGVSTVAQQ
jgi:hypothetical protein